MSTGARSLRTLALALSLVAISCAAPSASAAGQTAAPSIPRCSDGRPQSEIDHAGALPFAVTSPEIVCVAIAEAGTTSHDRAYRLRDTRMLHVYESTVPLPSKPSTTPLATGRVTVAKAGWSWLILDGRTPTLVLHVDRSDIYVELDLPLIARDPDLRLLQSIAGSVALP